MDPSSIRIGGIQAYAVILERRRRIWARGHEIFGEDPDVYREDDFGKTMRFNDYGDRQSAYGWEEDHIIANALGGSDDISNLCPLHWRNNASLGGHLGNIIADTMTKRR